MVAEKSIVCLVAAVILMISFICSAKTSSNILSASSRMRTSREWTLKEGVLWRWSISRPGVAEGWIRIVRYLWLHEMVVKRRRIVKMVDQSTGSGWWKKADCWRSLHRFVQHGQWTLDNITKNSLSGSERNNVQTYSNINLWEQQQHQNVNPLSFLPMITSGFFLSTASCALTSKPPAANPKSMLVNCANCLATWKTWTANSRVGSKTKTREQASDPWVGL